VKKDRRILEDAGYDLRTVRDGPSFVEIVVEKNGESSLMQWVHDSAYRFFPLIKNDDLGLTLHPFDLATNKVLAMAGRLEPRDWIDVITCHRDLQPLGYLVWAACGKDPGFSPVSLLHEIQRGSRYSQAELDILDFDGAVPDAARLGAAWHAILKQAAAICEALPGEKAGSCVVCGRETLAQFTPNEIPAALADGKIAFHTGRIGGAWPIFP
jgi:hypothetical protein